MASQDPRVRQRIIQLRNDNEDLPFSLIAEMVNEKFDLEGKDQHTKDSAQKIYYRHKEGGSDTPDEEYTQVPPSPSNLTDQFRKWIGDSWEPKSVNKSNRSPLSRRVCAVGDLHGDPDPHIIRAIAACDPTHIIIGGDSMDSKQASPHIDEGKKNGRTLMEEASAVRASFEYLLDNTSAIIDIIEGNHDQWTKKLVTEKVPEWLLDFFTDPLDLIVDGLPVNRVHRINTQLTFMYPDGRVTPFTESRFLYPFGDALISHMNFTSKLPGQAVTKLAAWIEEHRQQLGLPEFALYIQNHGHKSAKLDTRSGWRVLVEPGMGGNMQTEGYKSVYKTSWLLGTPGFTYFEQNNIAGEWLTNRSTIKNIQPNV